jgi:hypothetical protein
VAPLSEDQEGLGSLRSPRTIDVLLGEKEPRLCGEAGRLLDLDPVAGVREHVELGAGKFSAS